MAIPDYQALMLPLLRSCSDGKNHLAVDLIRHMAEEFGLSEEERRQLLPSGRQTVIANRTHWALTYMVHAGLLERPQRGQVRITARGRELFSRGLERIDLGVLASFPEFRAFRARSAGLDEGPWGEHEALAARNRAHGAAQTPEDRIRAAQSELDAALRAELLERIRKSDPRFFERLVVQLLVKMGYGSDLGGSALAIGGSGDGGIDGLIDQDPLGLDRVYIQAKRYAADNPVATAAILQFSGALAQKSASKGVFITTSRFTEDARTIAARLPQRIVLIDGDELGRLMIRHDVGVRIVETFHIKRIDEDFFIEE